MPRNSSCPTLSLAKRRAGPKLLVCGVGSCRTPEADSSPLTSLPGTVPPFTRLQREGSQDSKSQLSAGLSASA